MITKYELLEHAAYTGNDLDIFYDRSTFAYMYGDCEVIASFDNEDDAYDAWQNTNDYYKWIGSYENGEYEVVCYTVREVAYSDLGKCLYMENLVYD